jgi:hypothetical protein
MGGLNGYDEEKVHQAIVDVLAETAAALGWCVGVLQGSGKPEDVPVWVTNALHHAARPCDEASTRAHLQRMAAARHRQEVIVRT